MDIWDLCLLEQEEENRIKQIIDDNGLILFFKKIKNILVQTKKEELYLQKLKITMKIYQKVGTKKPHSLFVI